MNLEDASDKVERKEEKKEGRKRQKKYLIIVARRLTVKMVFFSYSDLFSPIAPLDSTLLYLQGEKIRNMDLSGR